MGMRRGLGAMQSGGGVPHACGTAQLLRCAREQRGMDVRDCAQDADITAERLLRLEAGTEAPDRSVLLRLADVFGLSLRLRNELLTRAGFEAPHPETPLGRPGMDAVRAMLDHILRSHGDCPAMAVDRMWNLVSANEAADLITDSVPPALRVPHINMLRTSVHPDCLARWMVNSAEWTGHLLGRFQQKMLASQDADLVALYEELRGYLPGAAGSDDDPRRFSLLRIIREGEHLALLNVETAFALPVDVTVDEITVQAFFPADRQTAEVLRRRAHTRADTRARRTAG